MEDQVYLEYVKRIANEFGKRGMVVYLRQIEHEGKILYGVRIVEDPNFPDELIFWFDERFVSADPHSVEKYVDDAVEKMGKNVSPLMHAHNVLAERSYENIKDKIVPVFINKMIYKKYIDTVPHRDHLDFTITYCYKHGSQMVTLNNELIAGYGISEEQLYVDSLKNIRPQDPVDLNAIVSDKQIELYEEVVVQKEMDQDIPLYVLSNMDFVNGSHVILRPDYLEHVSKKLQGDYYVFTGLNLFVIATPVRKNKIGVDKLNEIARKVYKHYEKPELVYSDKVYFYRSLSGKLVPVYMKPSE